MVRRRRAGAFGEGDECRRSFEPARTAPWQQTCSRQCQKRRHNRRARGRRWDDLEAARHDERERQRQCRAGHRAAPPTCTYGQADICTWLGGEGVAEGSMSRTGFGSEPCSTPGPPTCTGASSTSATSTPPPRSETQPPRGGMTVRNSTRPGGNGPEKLAAQRGNGPEKFSSGGGNAGEN